MPYKPPRILRHPERKLRPVPARLGSSLAKKYSLPRNSRIYYDINRGLFCTFIGPESTKGNHWTVFSERLAAQGSRPWGMSTLKFSSSGNFVEITDVQKESDCIKSSRGQMLFRALLNEALRVAKAKGAACVKIQSRNEKLASYYGRFGFEFDDPEDWMFGTLRLHKMGHLK